MAISLASYIRKCPHFDPTKWGCAMESADDKAKFLFDLSVREIRNDSKQLLLELSRVKKTPEEVTRYHFQTLIYILNQIFNNFFHFIFANFR